MNGLSLSGGGTKVAALAGAAITLLKEYKYKPDKITGVSAGSILAVPLAMGLYLETEYLAKSFTMNDVFGISPVRKNGKLSIRAILRAIAGKESLGTQTALIDTIKKLITPYRFEQYINGNYPDCYLCAVEYKTGQRRFFNVKHASYSEYIEIVLASSSVPVFVESVKMEGGYWYDGGVRDHIASHWLLEEFTLKNHFSIYSRPEDYNLTKGDWQPKNIMSVLSRTMEIMNTEISKNDELREDVFAIRKGTTNTKIFMPAILADGMYQATPALLQEWYEIGVKTTRKKLEI